MKKVTWGLSWLSVTAGVLYMVLHPDTGIVYDNPVTTLGLGLIGLGLFIDLRKAQRASSAA